MERVLDQWVGLKIKHEIEEDQRRRQEEREKIRERQRREKPIKEKIEEQNIRDNYRLYTRVVRINS